MFRFKKIAVIIWITSGSQTSLGITRNITFLLINEDEI